MAGEKADGQVTDNPFPGDLPLAAFGGASGDWQRGYRWGWEDAAEKAKPPPPFSSDVKKGYDAGQAAYERENR